MKNTLRKLAVPTALVLGIGGAATGMEAFRLSLDDLQAQSAAELRVPGPETLSSAFRNASRTALPAVVRVEVQVAPRAVKGRAVPEQYRGTPFEQFFRGPQRGAPAPSMGSGSGFIISPDGYVLTNNHVVDNATRVVVKLTDKREFEAEVVGRDPNTDVAVLKVNARGLPTVELGDADRLQIGDWVLALGYPLSVGETATAGIVSAKGKSINILRQNEDADAPLEHFIQTDAAINPGNSGGPLVDIRGRVVGINTAIASPTGFYSGYGFAVPVNLAKRVADDLIHYGTVRRPKLGVQINDVSEADAEVFGLSAVKGALIAADPQGPAKEAGLRMGDVIVAIEGEPVKDVGELMERVALRQPGERIRVDVVRYGDRKRFEVKLGSFEREAAVSKASKAAKEDALARLGFEAVEVTPAFAQRNQLSFKDGVMIAAVDGMGPAPQSLRGFRIEKLNGRDIQSLQDLRAAASKLAPGATVSLIGRYSDGTQTIVNYRLRG